MTTIENSSVYRGYKYNSLEEAEEANRKNTIERHQQNREHYNEYQRKYQQKVRDKKNKFEQISNSPLYPFIEQVVINPQLYQQVVCYINMTNNPQLYQQFIDYINMVNAQQG